jgi:hypothetical protein
MVKNGVSTQLTNAGGVPFFAVPIDAGPRTMDYNALFIAGTYSLTIAGECQKRVNRCSCTT